MATPWPVVGSSPNRICSLLNMPDSNSDPRRPAQASLARQVLADPVHWLAFGFGAGLLPVAPGTWGSLLAVLLFALLPPLPWQWTLAGLAALFVAGIWICGASARRLGVHDHGGIVLDEVLGMGLVLLITPPGWLWILAAFLLFRLFDVWKPWPIRDVDHSVSGGLGIMLDDVLAAAYAMFFIWLIGLAIAVF